MPLNSNALTTLADCKTQLEIPALDTTQDSLIERYINACSTMIEKHCNRSFLSQSYTRFYDGNAKKEILLGHVDVTAITSVSVDNNRVFSDLLPATEYGLLNKSTLRRHSCGWTIGSQNIKVVFVAGFLTIPSDVDLACSILVEWIYRSKNDRRVGRSSVTKSAGDSVDYVQGWPSEAIDLLESYVIPGSMSSAV